MDTKVKKKKEQVEYKNIKIEKLYSYKTDLTEYDRHIITREAEASKLYPDETLPTIVDPDVRIGIEVEVENVPRINDYNMHCWTLHDDNSLRNNGREFVTWPIKGQTIPRALTVLFKEILRPGYDFSKRTSVHVHMNIRNMTSTQIAAYVCLFIVFEKLLYKFVGHNRHKNIFCVPIQQTLISNELLPAMDSAFKNCRWYKYSGLNLLPIHTQGSVEMRQLHGTDDVDLIVSWVNLLLRMRQYAVNDHLENILSEIRDLNTNSQYDMFMRKVFQNEARLLDITAIGQDMESGVICVKQSTLINRFHQGMLEGIKLESPLISPLVEEAKISMKKHGYNYDGSRKDKQPSFEFQTVSSPATAVATESSSVYSEDDFDFGSEDITYEVPEQQLRPVRLEGTRDNRGLSRVQRELLNRVQATNLNLSWDTASFNQWFTVSGEQIQVAPAPQEQL